jgi:hypothetical protein
MVFPLGPRNPWFFDWDFHLPALKTQVVGAECWAYCERNYLGDARRWSNPKKGM